MHLFLCQANDETLAVGMVDGLVSVRRRETEPKISKPSSVKQVIPNKYLIDNARADHQVRLYVAINK